MTKWQQFKQMKITRFAWKWVKKIAVWFVIVSIGSTILFRFLPIPFTPLMIKRLFEQGFDSKRDMRLSKDWVGFDNLPEKLQLAVICGEDQNFLEHNGLDFDAIERAIEHNKNHKKKWGASTISQQTAKNVFLWPTRSFIRKGFEVWFTFLIEIFWSKERIMTVYLNVIEFGDGIYGAEAAAQNYFGKSARNLNPDECALLAAVVPGPLLYSVKNPSSFTRRRQKNIRQQMRAWGNEVDYDDPNTPKK
jgi:monofunctional glycosyltransferase